jgi:predicted metal-dependent enzyme (double-stranded beta helix superfamily)
MLDAVEKFVSQVRDMHARNVEPDELWSKASEYLADVLKDPEVREHAKGWPTSPAKLGLEGKHANLLFYEDPDYGFVINGLIKAPNAKTTVHDHGVSSTLYGVVTGGEEVLRYERTDGGKPGDLPDKAEVAETERVEVAPGYVDYIKPWDIHAEFNGSESTAALIVRSQRCGTYVQNIFYRDTGTVEQYYGPDQIPYNLG